MPRGYRSWAERREIIRAIIAESNSRSVASFNLTPSEEVYFRARSAKAVERLARESSTFKEYYALPAARPFDGVIALAVLVGTTAAIGAVTAFWQSGGDAKSYPLISAFCSVAVVALGWVVVSGISHRNTIRQNTNNTLFARFSQAPFGDALHRFHKQFGHDYSPVTESMLDALRATGDDDDRKAATAAGYILNYLEFIAAGVLHGDLDQEIIRNNIRGVLCFYYDKCESYIRSSNRENPRTYEHLIKLRTHYREP